MNEHLEIVSPSEAFSSELIQAFSAIRLGLINSKEEITLLDRWSVYLASSCSSTMDIAREIVSASKAQAVTKLQLHESGKVSDGEAVIISRNQTKGRGRQGRNWYSVSEQGLYLSVVLNPNRFRDNPATISLVLAYTVFNTFAGVGVCTKLKWPNDVLVYDQKSGSYKKIAGLLLESRPASTSTINSFNVTVQVPGQKGGDFGVCAKELVKPDKLYSANSKISASPKRLSAPPERLPFNIIAGIGINLNQTFFPSELAAISAAQILGKELNYCSFLADLLSRVVLDLDIYAQDGFISFRDRWWQASMMENVEIAVQSSEKNGLTFGIPVGLNDDGALLVRSLNAPDEIFPVYSGEVHVKQLRGGN